MLGRRSRQRQKRRPQLGEPLARAGRDAHHGGSGQERALHELGRLHRGERLALGVGQVALGERHEAARHTKQAADVKVLARLRHHRLVRRHHQQHGVDAVGTGQHVADEALVAGHVHERGHDVPCELDVGEAEVDRDPAGLLFREPIGVGAGERAHQRALAVVDVARRPDDEGPQGCFSPRGS